MQLIYYHLVVMQGGLLQRGADSCVKSASKDPQLRRASANLLHVAGAPTFWALSLCVKRTLEYEEGSIADQAADSRAFEFSLYNDCSRMYIE